MRQNLTVQPRLLLNRLQVGQPMLIQYTQRLPRVVNNIPEPLSTLLPEAVRDFCIQDFCLAGPVNERTCWR